MTLLVAPPLAPRAALREIERLRSELRPAHLTDAQRRELEAALAAAADELARDEPEPRRLAGHVARLTTVLRAAGVQADADTGAARALTRLRLRVGPLPF